MDIKFIVCLHTSDVKLNLNKLLKKEIVLGHSAFLDIEFLVQLVGVKGHFDQILQFAYPLRLDGNTIIEKRWLVVLISQNLFIFWYVEA